MRHLLAEFRRGAAADRHTLIGCVVVWAALLTLLAGKGVNGLEVSSYLANLVLYLAVLLIVVAGRCGWLLLSHRCVASKQRST